MNSGRIEESNVQESHKKLGEHDSGHHGAIADNDVHQYTQDVIRNSKACLHMLAM